MNCEFPIAPIGIEDQAPLRTLQAPEPVTANFECIIADASRPPFRKGSFDTIITPWITDILPEDLARQAARINSLLAEDGQWLNFGSLAFEHADPARRYGIDEFIDIIHDQGFAHPRSDETRIPYMCSPASRHGRRETVFSYAAIKLDRVKTPGRYKALPDWIVTGKESVPLLESFRAQAMTSQIYSLIMSMIDGKRSLQDMAVILEKQKLMTRAEAEPAIRSFLIKMYDDSEKPSGI